MWREFIRSITESAEFAPPATQAEIADVEAKLGVVVPANLRSLLQETNGITVSDNSYFDSVGEVLHWRVLCSTNEIIELNTEWRGYEADWIKEDAATPIILQNLLLFTCEPNGDPVGFPVKDGKADETQVVVFSHDGAEPQTKERTLREQVAHLLRTV